MWVIDPERHEARVYRSDGTVGLVGADGELDGEGVLAGFRCPLAGILLLTMGLGEIVPEESLCYISGK